jgi:hypothetical protein
MSDLRHVWGGCCRTESLSRHGPRSRPAAIGHIPAIPARVAEWRTCGDCGQGPHRRYQLINTAGRGHRCEVGAKIGRAWSACGRRHIGCHLPWHPQFGRNPFRHSDFMDDWRKTRSFGNDPLLANAAPCPTFWLVRG